MTDENKLPYGYQLSFFERLKLRLKKLNYRLSLALSIAFFVSWCISRVGLAFLQGAQLLYWQKTWSSLAFLLLGFEGLIWVITGERKKAANLTYRGKSVMVLGIGLWLVCWYIAVNLFLK